jgi:hypothetical protein
MRYHQKTAARFSANAPQQQLRQLARELGGDIGGPSWILAPGLGMPHTDRSLQITLSAAAPDGFAIVSRSVSRIEARAHVLAAIQRLRSIKDEAPDLFGRAKDADAEIEQERTGSAQ